MPKQIFYRAGTILRINLRRDWVKIIIWLIVLSGLFASVAAKFNTLYGSKTAIEQITTTLATPAMVSLFGHLPASPYTSADVFASEMTVFMAIFGAIMNFSFAVSLTRGDEDSGVTELVSARHVGPYATLMAAMLELFIINALLTILYSGGLQLAGLNGTDTMGNLVLGVGLGLNGLMFGLLATLVAQLVDSSRAATGLAYGLFGLMYLIRMVTDVSHPRYTWLSPLGWIEKLQTYRQNNWLPAILMVLFIIVFAACTVLLRAHRDLNAGIMPTRPGRRTASFALRGPIGLFWRLERNQIFAWWLGLFIFAAMYGSVFNTVAGILKSNPITVKLLANPQTATAATNQVLFAFIALLMTIFTVCAIIPGLQTIYRLVTDEQRGYLEMLHARSVSRLRLFLTILCFGLVTSLGALAMSVVGLAVTANTVLSKPLSTDIFWRAFVANTTPLLIMLAIGTLFVGWLPRFRTIVWGYIGLAFVLGYFGKLFNLADWVMKLTPFGYIGHVPATNLNWTTFGWQFGLSIILFILGGIGYLKRDINGAN